jgi:hypothetical protein
VWQNDCGSPAADAHIKLSAIAAIGRAWNIEATTLVAPPKFD